jgi:hypothetical protein
MDFLSFDVGIRNFAYCIVSYQDEEQSDFKIKEWGIINLIENEQQNSHEQEKCKCYNKNKKICGGKAKHYAKINDKLLVYCNKHLCEHEKIMKFVAPTQFHQTTLNNYEFKPSCSYHNKKKCDKTGRWYYNNNDNNKIYLCSAHKANFLQKELKSRQARKIKKIKCNSIPIDLINLNMTKILDEHYKHFLQIPTVLIELQPVYLGPKMKSVSNHLFSYFMIRGIIDKNINNSQTNYITYMSAKSKLTIDEENNVDLMTKDKTKVQKYKIHKQMAQDYTRKLLANDTENLNYFNSQSKKDDLADAFLQCVYYIIRYVRKK